MFRKTLEKEVESHREVSRFKLVYLFCFFVVFVFLLQPKSQLFIHFTILSNLTAFFFQKHHKLNERFFVQGMIRINNKISAPLCDWIEIGNGEPIKCTRIKSK